jgi:hypothetical protein
VWKGLGKWLAEHSTWQNAGLVAAYGILGLEGRQVLIGAPVDQRDLSLLLIAAGLLGLVSAFRRNGAGRNGSASRE